MALPCVRLRCLFWDFELLFLFLNNKMSRVLCTVPLAKQVCEDVRCRGHGPTD